MLKEQFGPGFLKTKTQHELQNPTLLFRFYVFVAIKIFIALKNYNNLIIKVFYFPLFDNLNIFFTPAHTLSFQNKLPSVYNKSLLPQHIQLNKKM